MVKLFGFINEDNELVVSTDSQSGEPCVCIPLDRDAVFAWIAILVTCVESGDWDGDLPGRMAVISSNEEGAEP